VTRYILVPGAGGTAWYWNLVVRRLELAGHLAVAVDLPGDDERVGPIEYADLVVAAADGDPDSVLVAASLGGFTAALAVQQMTVRALVFVNAMIPEPGETAGAWWDDVDAVSAREQAADEHGYSREFDLDTYFLHDVSPELAAEGEPYQRNEAEIGFAQSCDFAGWPSVPTRVLAGADDRFFPLELQRRVARERLGLEVDTVSGGHLVALANPIGVTDHLVQSV
jgi:pimeloyl-ACP methyl ester carboxylesterase